MATSEFTIVVHPAKCRCTNPKHGHGDTCEREEVSSAGHLCTECHEIDAANAMEQINQAQGNVNPVNPQVYHHGGISKVGG
jgi:hypothetical protein